MRILSIITIFLLVVTACEYDNYDPPSSEFTGSIVYNGDPLAFAHGDVYFELWEPGWQESAPIDVAIAQDGSFSALLFEADYKLVFPQGQDPFLPLQNNETNSDTINLSISGSTNMDIEVLPYYIFNSSSISASGDQVNATCSISQIITDGENARDISEVTLFVGKTQFVSSIQNVASASVAGTDITDLNNISLQVTVPEQTIEQTEFFARIGIKISGVTDLLYTNVVKVQVQF